MLETPYVAGVGHNCLDRLCTVEAYPPENGSTHITAMQTQGGGAVATALVACARLGVAAAMVGYLGADDTGGEIIGLLQRDGVNTDAVTRLPGRRSSVSYVMVNPANASRTKFPYPDALPAIQWDAAQRRVVENARVLHLDGTQYENALAAAQIAKKAGVTVSLDGCSMQQDNEKNRRLASLADILIMNAKYPLRVAECDNYEQALLRMAGWGPRVVIGTQGEQGCVAVIEGETVRIPAYGVAAVDTTGAGDVFHGAFLAGWLQGMPLLENIRFAAAASALKCTKIGGRAGIPTREQALALVRQNA